VIEENRLRKRFHPVGLAAQITINPPLGRVIALEGQVVDMSYGGIKIKLNEPFGNAVEEAELNITIVLPESGVPVSIRGRIKHIVNREEYGLKYNDEHMEYELDDLMFECVNLALQPMDE
jgi:PilZ domain